ncbi:MAG: lysozyme inhibitor LprI family protein [Lachnospiraceae bacterium]
MNRKKRIWIVVATVLLIGVVISYMSRPMTMNDIYKEPNFMGSVLEVSERTILVLVNEEEDERRSSDKISVSLDTQLKDDRIQFEVGDIVQVFYNGEIAESYPAQIHHVYAILFNGHDNALSFEELSTSSEIVLETDIKEEKVTSQNKMDTTSEYLKQCEKKYAELENELQHDLVTQLEMNENAQTQYELWDSALNYVWSMLYDMDKITDELKEKQKEWIINKEKDVDDAGADYVGGSMEGMVRSLEGARITKERTYELMELLQEMK